MSDPGSSRYIQRVAEQEQIIAEAEIVRATSRSRAVFVYGRGGMGKTRLLRQLEHVIRDPNIKCLAPIDVDDSQHWLLSNLERYVADRLDPDRQYFAEFHQYVSALPRHRLTPTSREMILSHLNQIKAVFTRCYKGYIDATGHCVVITFDTTEAIRGMYLLRVFTEWIRALPGTLFVLAGRSPANLDGWRDPVRAALEDSTLNMPVRAITVGEFTAADCLEYLAPLSEEARLSVDQKEKLVHLTQGNPLWLALTVDYLATLGMPKEALAPLDEIKRDLPYHGDATASGRARAEDFKQGLMAPYQEADFWHEATKRLAVVRESVSEPIWRQLMAGRQLPADVADFGQAWRSLCKKEWIRLRANDRYVTLHDAVAEELARRVFKLHDTDGSWRRELWSRAAGIYADQAAELAARLAERLPGVDAKLRDRDAVAAGDSVPLGAEDDAALIAEVTELDNRRQELNQLKVAYLFYRLLSDSHEGAGEFVEMLRQAKRDHDVLLEDLLAFQMQSFLPGGADENSLDDTVGTTIREFRDWLRAEAQDSYVDIGIDVADYLIHREQPEVALHLLDQLPVPLDGVRRYRIRNLQGNACLRIPGRARESAVRFQGALAEASQLPASDRDRYTADAYKELGFYYRNVGRWKQADESYRRARDAISRALSSELPDSDRAQLASIYSNWAYVKGIGGRYEEGISLVESAIDLRRRLGMRLEQAMSCGVKGEVYRYQRQFKEAWDAYAEAQELFEEQSSWSWLGVIFQEQAICLFQSIPARVQLLEQERAQDPAERAEKLIERSLELCKDFNVRAYPSALNRAGRIFGARDPDRGLSYLLEGAEKARGLSDGWFWMASLIEYAELSYSTWLATGESKYIEGVHAIGEKIRDAEKADLEFPELRGRWRVLLGHIAMQEILASGSADALQAALESYRTGFPLIAQGWVGSYGASAIPREFKKAKELARKLPPETRVHWRQSLFSSWSSKPESTTQLLPLLEDLY